MISFHSGHNEYISTHWGRATHICVGKLTTTGSDNGLSPGRRQAIIWTIAGILLIRPLGTNFSEISYQNSNTFIQHEHISQFSFISNSTITPVAEIRASHRLIIIYFQGHCCWYVATAGIQGLYSLSGKTSYRQISWSLEAARLGVIMIVSLSNLTGRDACYISEQSEKSKPESRSFETSRDFAVRRLTA